MNNWFFPKFAANNIKKNGKTYIPYILTCIMTVAMFYIVKSLSMNPGMEEMTGGNTLAYMLELGSSVVAFFAFIFLFYTNSFLVKRRKREFGVFNILGMEKWHLAKALAWETLYVTIISLAGGLVLGMALDKAMFLLVSQVVGAEIPLGFFVSGSAVSITMVLFAVIFLMIFLNSVRQIQMSNPIELIRDGNAGEKEPRTKWLTAILGAACMSAGYYIALTTENPLSSFLLFFVAVILVISGTYMLFTAGSIALLKALRKNKKYYYKTKHFISVSGMIYRMKQNAVGLANICILSTAVLIMVSSTTALMLGMEDAVQNRHPNDFAIYASESEKRSYELFDSIRKLQREWKLNVTQEAEYEYLSFAAYQDENSLLEPQKAVRGKMDQIKSVLVVSLEDYNRVMGTKKTLDEGEILLYSSQKQYEYPELRILGREYKIKEKLQEYVGNGLLTAVTTESQCIVVPDKMEVYQLCELQKAALGNTASDCQYYYGFDTDADEEEQKAFYEEALDTFADGNYEGTMESKAKARANFIGLYGGFFFVGIFLGILFIMATVLIIYYKQISEGYEDKQRFQIMQKVGMSRREVKGSIRSQVVTVFFLPLGVAGIHVGAAFPMIVKMLKILNLQNVQLYLACTIVCFLVFAAMYLLIYLLTARTYYRIVSR